MAETSGFRELLSQITVEPAVFLYQFCAFFSQPARLSLVYERLCMKHFSSDVICDNLYNETFKEEEDVVQGSASHLLNYGNMLEAIPPMFLIFVYGTISDKYSRKLPILLPLIGSLLLSFVCLLMAAIPQLPVEIYLIGKVLDGCGGAWVTFTMAAISYMASVTTKAEHTKRFGVIEGMAAAGLAAAYFLSGLIMAITNIILVFGLVLFLQFIAVFYILLFISDVKPNQDDVVSDENNICWKILKTLRNIIRPRAQNGRCHLVMLLLSMFIIVAASTRKSSSLYFEAFNMRLRQQPLDKSRGEVFFT